MNNEQLMRGNELKWSLSNLKDEEERCAILLGAIGDILSKKGQPLGDVEEFRARIKWHFERIRERLESEFSDL